MPSAQKDHAFEVVLGFSRRRSETTASSAREVLLVTGVSAPREA